MSPRAHIQQPPLPWHTPEQARTWCGRPVTTTTRITTLAPARNTYGDDVCKVCAGVARHPRLPGEPAPSFDTAPVEIVYRWVERWRWGHSNSDEPAVMLARELRAVAALVAKHRSEFTELLDLAAWCPVCALPAGTCACVICTICGQGMRTDPRTNEWDLCPSGHYARTRQGTRRSDRG